MPLRGLEIVQGVYRRLRMPSQQTLPYQTVVATLANIIAQKKSDLALSEQNHLAQTSPWFVPSSTDFPLEDLGLSVLLPVRVEVKAFDSEFETGENVPIVNYMVLDTSIVGAVGFYGEPIRIAFRDELDYVIQHQYRIVYESDFEDRIEVDGSIELPAFFASLVIYEAAYELIDMIEDSVPEWMTYLKIVNQKWPLQIADKRTNWMRYVRKFKGGRAEIPKRTFFQNRAGRPRTRFFNT